MHAYSVAQSLLAPKLRIERKEAAWRCYELFDISFLSPRDAVYHPTLNPARFLNHMRMQGCNSSSGNSHAKLQPTGSNDWQSQVEQTELNCMCTSSLKSIFFAFSGASVFLFGVAGRGVLIPRLLRILVFLLFFGKKTRCFESSSVWLLLLFSKAEGLIG